MHRTPDSGNGGRTKKMRPDTPRVKFSPRTPIQTQVQENGEKQPDTENQIQEDHLFAFVGPVLFVPFLPTMASKLLLSVDGRFDSVEWYPSSSKVPISGDSFFQAWGSQEKTTSGNFIMQNFHGFTGDSFRIVAKDPDNDQIVVPLAKSVSQSEAKLLLELFEELEQASDFDYASIWKYVSREGI